MNLIDFVLIVFVLSLAIFLVYRSFFKKGGACASCKVGNCQTKQLYSPFATCPEIDATLKSGIKREY